jgi:hypothetical protein
LDAQPKNINNNNDKFAELLQQLTLNKKHHLVTGKRLLDASKPTTNCYNKITTNCCKNIIFATNYYKQ